MLHNRKVASTTAQIVSVSSAFRGTSTSLKALRMARILWSSTAACCRVLTGIEIRLFLVIDAFSRFSGIALACSADLSLALAKQLLDFTAAGSSCGRGPTGPPSRPAPGAPSGTRLLPPELRGSSSPPTPRHEQIAFFQRKPVVLNDIGAEDSVYKVSGLLGHHLDLIGRDTVCACGMPNCVHGQEWKFS